MNDMTRLFAHPTIPEGNVDALADSGGGVVGGREIREYEVVRLVSDKYQNIGLAKGEVGTVVDIIPAKIPGYTVEFHEIDLSSPAGIKTFRREEIELVEDGSDE